jgi:hypothetical protein
LAQGTTAAAIVSARTQRYAQRAMIEVHAPERPARPFVAIVTSALLLLGVVALAALVSQRRRNVVLSPSIHVPGWAVTFRAPEGWERGVGPTAGEESIMLYDASDAGARRRLTISRWPGKNTGDPQRIALVLLESLVDFRLAPGRNVTWEGSLPLGVLPGGRATLVLPTARRAPRAVVLHVGIASPRDAYTVRLDTQGPLGARDAAILALVADSVQWAPNRSVVLNSPDSLSLPGRRLAMERGEPR